ncbi:MAG: YggS family pyridoxal phosphate-dependent enzyme [Chloroflexi bacterium]|nr:YggS family pyridoxal phosphate-dependent enzyme [Chloroflexota bacterium]
MAALEQNLARVRERMAAAARRAGRDPDEVRLIAVSKTHSPQVVRVAMALGLRDFGENRVEEALPKMAAVGPGPVWHMIGHVQSRKARQIAGGGFALLHSLDSMKLARRLDRFDVEAGRRLPVLLECNLTGKAGKAGYLTGDPARWEDWLPEWQALAALPGLELRGLMTMAPYLAPPEVIRGAFASLRRLRDFLTRRCPAGDPGPTGTAGAGWRELSMGMTDDFELAIEEGATLIRVGRAIFGERN